MDKLAEAGVNAVGIHLESADEKIREEMCPGKTNYGTIELYRETWQYAIQLFGRGNVSTYLLHGLGEDIETTLLLQKLHDFRRSIVPIAADSDRNAGPVPAKTRPGSTNT